MVEVKAQLNHLRMSDKKVRLVGDMVKGMDAQMALARLKYIPRHAAPVLAQLLRSAIANAEHNNNLKKENLFVKNIIVNQGVALKRWRPAAFGSAHGFKKHASHITLVLGLKPSAATTTGTIEKAAKDAAVPAVAEKKSAVEKVRSRIRRTPRTPKKAKE
jgi:large subunit ribosomal protein L22